MDRQIDREIERETDRPTDRESDTQVQTDREKRVVAVYYVCTDLYLYFYGPQVKQDFNIFRE